MDWRAPEVIAHIVAAEPDLFGEYAPVMIEAALMEPIFYPSLRKAKNTCLQGQEADRISPAQLGEAVEEVL